MTYLETSTVDGFPTYAEISQRSDAPRGSTWGLFGENSDLGTVNFITPEVTRNALDLARRGVVINLDVAWDEIDVPPSRHRSQMTREMRGQGLCQRDDVLTVYPQAVTHFDGLGHIRHPQHGFYNGADDESVRSGKRLGVEGWSRHGLVTRAVLADIPRYLTAVGLPALDLTNGTAIDIDVVKDALRWANIDRRSGDVILLRTGWLDYYLHDISAEERAAIPAQLRSPGLLQSERTLEWLWDTQVSAIVADNAGVECFPPVPGSTFGDNLPEGAGIPPGLMHPDMIALLGLAIGELWWLETLADDCAADGVYEMLFCSKPSNIAGGVGAPANALALK